MLGVMGLAVHLTYGEQQSQATWILLAFAVLMFWISFLMPTYCDYITQRGSPCTRQVRGKLRGCRTHGRLKRDALFAALRLRNPGQLIRTLWSSPGEVIVPARTGSDARPASAQPSKQGAYDGVMLAFTGVSAIAAVLALFV